jgi:translation initiation factor IF-2
MAGPAAGRGRALPGLPLPGPSGHLLPGAGTGADPRAVGLITVAFAIVPLVVALRLGRAADRWRPGLPAGRRDRPVRRRLRAARVRRHLGRARAQQRRTRTRPPRPDPGRAEPGRPPVSRQPARPERRAVRRRRLARPAPRAGPGRAHAGLGGRRLAGGRDHARLPGRGRSGRARAPKRLPRRPAGAGAAGATRRPSPPGRRAGAGERRAGGDVRQPGHPGHRRHPHRLPAGPRRAPRDRPGGGRRPAQPACRHLDPLTRPHPLDGPAPWSGAAAGRQRRRFGAADGGPAALRRHHRPGRPPGRGRLLPRHRPAAHHEPCGAGGTRRCPRHRAGHPPDRQPVGPGCDPRGGRPGGRRRRGSRPRSGFSAACSAWPPSRWFAASAWPCPTGFPGAGTGRRSTAADHR